MDTLLSEKELAETIGVNRQKIKEIRKEYLTENQDWDLVRGAIRISNSGVKKICEFLKISSKNAAPEEGPLPPAPIDDKAVTTALVKYERKKAVVTVNRFFRNRRIIECLNDQGEPIRVRVKTNHNFRSGMKAPVYQVSEDLWELARACPRFRGRW